MLPFGADVFFFVFEQYNHAIWPAQVVAYVLGLLVLGAAMRPFPGSGRLVGAVLALAWLWNGIAYHVMHFAGINFWAYGFGALFVIQGLLFAWTAARGRLAIRFAPDPAGWTGLGLALFAMALYPLIGALAGHGWPRAPVFGVAPCPTTIFTWGVLLMSARMPRHLAIVPLVWSLIGGTAAFFLGVPEDLALPVAALIAIVLMLLRGRRTPAQELRSGR
ncbi:MAG: DUF6064 family protein [Xanthobacteraceae bacterium]|nr:DUF6064 family protein [Xanthobacteraceae bacterium]PWB66765.1 MAG: hypothetical protein C3F17_00760 [Bradyrhizobiaceae bacterium]